MDYNAFLKLLIAQLKNQDPTKPMDSTQFVAQLATFSQVEQSIATNSKLDALLTASALSMADGVIGRTITSADGTTSGIVAVGEHHQRRPDGEARQRRRSRSSAPASRSADAMNEADAIESSTRAIWTIIVAAGPAVLAPPWSSAW